jgi:hypothetical protein
MIDFNYSRQTSPDYSGTPAITVSLTRHQRDMAVCAVVGGVEGTTRPWVRNALVEAGHDDNVHSVIDLSAVTSMGSAVRTWCVKPALKTVPAATVTLR